MKATEERIGAITHGVTDVACGLGKDTFSVLHWLFSTSHDDCWRAPGERLRADEVNCDPLLTTRSTTFRFMDGSVLANL